jgi:hypothetical protein
VRKMHLVLRWGLLHWLMLHAMQLHAPSVVAGMEQPPVEAKLLAT